jgi:glycosyltransferase involved in cell wall biosynthesis
MKRAWLLPGERMPVARPAAPQLRFARTEAWLRDLGYEPSTLFRGRLEPGSGTQRGTGRGVLDALTSLAAAPWLGLRAIRRRPALVISTGAINAPALAVIKRLLGSRVIVVVDAIGLRSLETEQTTRLPLLRRIFRALWRSLEGTAYRAADLTVTVNDRSARLIGDEFPEAEVATLRDAAEDDLGATQPAARERYGIPADAVAVGFLGSVVCARLDRLVSAWETLSARIGGGRNLHLVVIGSGPDLAAYRDWAARQATESVSFLGALPRAEALAVMSACDIAYTGNWSQAGFSFKLFEYMALGMPILVERRPQIEEVLADGVNVLLYDGSEELALKLEQLAGDPELRRRIGSAAHRTFLESHTLSRRQREFEALLCETEIRAERPENRPLVTALVPVKAYDPDLLRRALASVLTQSSPRWRLIVIADADQVGDLRRVLSVELEDPRVSIVVAERDGVAAALNTGLRATGTEFCAILLGDDMWAPGAVEMLEREISAHPEIDFLHSQREKVDEADQPIGVLRSGNDEVRPEDFLYGAPVRHLLCFRRSKALEIGGMDESFRFVGPDDYDFPWSMAESGASFRLIPEVLYLGREHRRFERLSTDVPARERFGELVRMWRKHGAGGIRGRVLALRAGRRMLTKRPWREARSSSAHRG